MVNGMTTPRFSLPDPMFNSMLDIAINAALRSLPFYGATGRPDKRRDIFEECGLGQTSALTVDVFKEMYDRDPVATRVVDVEPQEAWKVQPTVYENEETDQVTEFEQAWDALGKGLRGKSWFQDEKGSPVWEYLQRADMLSGIGEFGVLLVGLDDGLDLREPVEGVEEKNSMPVEYDPKKVEDDSSDVGSSNGDGNGSATTNKRHPRYSLTINAEKTKGRKLTYLRAFDESLVQIAQYESNRTSPRYGHPVLYNITLNDPNEAHSGIGLPLGSYYVHWTRVIHVADNLKSSEIFGVPRMRPVYNNLYGLRKLYCGSPEMYWKGAFPGTFFGTHPQLGGDVTIPSAFKDHVEQYMTGLQRYMIASGMTAQQLSPQVVDPTPQINTQIGGICIALACPVRIFIGSERGQLASDQDERAWRERMRGRRVGYVTPRLIVPFVDRLIMIGVLPEPKGYSVLWLEEEELPLTDRTSIAVQRTQAIGSYLSGGVEALVQPMDFFTRILGFDEEDAEAILESTTKKLEDEDRGSSPLLSMVGGIQGMMELFKQYKEGVIGEETLKQQIMTFFKLSEAQAEAIIADTEPPAEPEPTAPSPIKIKEGEHLVNPEDGSVQASGGPTEKDLEGMSDAELQDLADELSANAFCPTGEGGGVDTSCSPGKSGRKDDDAAARKEGFKDAADKARFEEASKPYAKGDKTYKKPSKGEEIAQIDKVRAAKAERLQKAIKEGRTGKGKGAGKGRSKGEKALKPIIEKDYKGRSSGDSQAATDYGKTHSVWKGKVAYMPPAAKQSLLGKIKALLSGRKTEYGKLPRVKVKNKRRK